MKVNFLARFLKSTILMIAAAVLVAMGFPITHAQEHKASPSADAGPSGDVANGRAIFMRDGCYHCHGFGAAGTGAAPALLANPIPLEAFIAYVRHPARSMPPFTDKIISDKDLTDIFAFIHSLPKPRDAKSIPMLNE